ncbi:MAG: DegT/DnrJ/EryC1/StrS family aminotransferase [Solirubrobacteraceae bacterium]
MSDAPWRIALADVWIGDEERAAVDEVLRSGWLSMGPRTEAFEEAFREFVGARHAFAVTNGTAALHLAAAAIGVEPGDEVIVPALTFVASAAAMRHAGATVTLADSTSIDDFSVDPEEVERLISPRTRAVVVVHYGGYPVDVAALERVSQSSGVAIIEDAAHALGSSIDGRSCGTLGAAAAFSFFPNKNMTTGEGGMVVVRDDDAAERTRMLRSHAMTTLTWDRHRGHASSYDVVGLGFNYRIDEIRAALGTVQLARLPQLNEQRAILAQRYRDRLDGHFGLRVPTFGGRGMSACHLAPLVAASEGQRDAIRERLREERIQTSLHYPAIHSFSAYVGAKGSLGVADSIAALSLTLPLHPKLALADVDEVSDVALEAAERAQ